MPRAPVAAARGGPPRYRNAAFRGGPSDAPPALPAGSSGGGKVVLASRGLAGFPEAALAGSGPADKWWLAELPHHLDLSDNPLIRAIPAAIAQLADALVVLRMPGCGLTALPPELFELGALKHLDVARNALEALPEAVNRLASLVDLTVSGNLLTSLPPLGGLARLELLRVAVSGWSGWRVD